MVIKVFHGFLRFSDVLKVFQMFKDFSDVIKVFNSKSLETLARSINPSTL
jgi:hypothetical protein